VLDEMMSIKRRTAGFGLRTHLGIFSAIFGCTGIVNAGQPTRETTPSIVTESSARPAAAERTTLPPPTHADIPYGPHVLNVLDIWLAPSKNPTPLLVHIHGGGWMGGDKRALAAATLSFMLEHGISVATINYRFSSITPLPGPVHDAARAIQFLRSKASGWNLDASHVAAIGSSAGGCTTLWLNYHADLTRPESSDPVARESTRLCAAVGINAQTSIDPHMITEWVGSVVLEHRMISRAVGAKDRYDLLTRSDYFRSLYTEFSAYNHVSQDDPPALLIYQRVSPLPAVTPGTAIHHPAFGQKLQEKADSCGAKVTLRISELGAGVAEVNEFLLQHLKS
jgi:arylformamidase